MGVTEATCLRHTSHSSHGISGLVSLSGINMVVHWPDTILDESYTTPIQNVAFL